jgi:hypothetical protein
MRSLRREDDGVNVRVGNFLILILNLPRAWPLEFDVVVSSQINDLIRYFQGLPIIKRLKHNTKVQRQEDVKNLFLSLSLPTRKLRH